MAKEPICIRRTATVEEADIIVAWLAERGVEAYVPDHENPGVMAFGSVDAEGIEIFVADEETAVQARQMLVDHDEEMAEIDAAPGALEVRCDECGAALAFPHEQAGSVQQCPECSAYVDVPESAG